MAFKYGEQIVETALETRQAKRGLKARNVPVVGPGLVLLAFAIIGR